MFQRRPMATKVAALLCLAPVPTLRSCSHNLVKTDKYVATAGDITTERITQVPTHRIGYLSICTLPEQEPCFRMHEAKVTTYIERNNKPGYQPDGDTFIDSRGMTSDVGLSKIEIRSISQQGPAGTGSHWQLDIETDRDSDGDGHNDHEIHHGSY